MGPLTTNHRATADEDVQVLRISRRTANSQQPSNDLRTAVNRRVSYTDRLLETQAVSPSPWPLPPKVAGRMTKLAEKRFDLDVLDQRLQEACGYGCRIVSFSILSSGLGQPRAAVPVIISVHWHTPAWRTLHLLPPPAYQLFRRVTEMWPKS